MKRTYLSMLNFFVAVNFKTCVYKFLNNDKNFEFSFGKQIINHLLITRINKKIKTF